MNNLGPSYYNPLEWSSLFYQFPHSQNQVPAEPAPTPVPAEPGFTNVTKEQGRYWVHFDNKTKRSVVELLDQYATDLNEQPAQTAESIRKIKTLMGEFISARDDKKAGRGWSSYLGHGLTSGLKQTVRVTTTLTYDEHSQDLLKRMDNLMQRCAEKM